MVKNGGKDVCFGKKVSSLEFTYELWLAFAPSSAISFFLRCEPSLFPSPPFCAANPRGLSFSSAILSLPSSPT